MSVRIHIDSTDAAVHPATELELASASVLPQQDSSSIDPSGQSNVPDATVEAKEPEQIPPILGEENTNTETAASDAVILDIQTSEPAGSSSASASAAESASLVPAAPAISDATAALKETISRRSHSPTPRDVTLGKLALSSGSSMKKTSMLGLDAAPAGDRHPAYRPPQPQLDGWDAATAAIPNDQLQRDHELALSLDREQRRWDAAVAAEPVRLRVDGDIIFNEHGEALEKREIDNERFIFRSNQPRPAPYKEWVSKVPFVPISAKTWRAVPKDVLSIIASFLDARSLTRFGCTDVQSRSVSIERKHWRRLVHRPWTYTLPKYQQSQEKHYLVDTYPLWNYQTMSPDTPCSLSERERRLEHQTKLERQANTASFMDALPMVMANIDKHEAAREYYRVRRIYALYRYKQYQSWYQQENLDVSKNKFAFPLHVFFDSLETPILASLLTICMILLVIQLQHGESVSLWSLWPILAIVAYLFLSGLFFAITAYTPVEWKIHSLFGLLPSTYAQDSRSALSVLLIHFVFPEDGTYGVGASITGWADQSLPAIPCLTVCMALLGVGTWLVFIVLKVSDILTWHWSLIFLPLYCTFYLTLLSRQSCFNWGYFAHETTLWNVFWLTLGLPFLAFCIMLPLRLQQYDTGTESNDLLLAKIFTPLWLIDLLLFLGSMYLSLLISASGGGFDDDDDDVNLLDCCIVFGLFFLLWCIGLAPLVVFKILLVMVIDHSYAIAWKYVFIPMFVFCGMALIASIYLSCLLIADRKYEWTPDDYRHKNSRALPPPV